MSKSSPSTSLRLDRFLATVTDYSRSEAKRLIKNGDITLDGEVLSDPRQSVDADADVRLRGQSLRSAEPRYFMLNKPVDYVCAARDRRHLTVLDLLDEDNPERLHVAGRLDIDTTGLVLLTDDGNWSHAITSPKKQCWKRYWLRTAEPIDASAVARFAKGVFLKDDKQRTQPAELEIIGPCEARLRLSEGRYHQVKRMFGALGNAVVELHREAIGDIELDEALAEGEYRPLTTTERDSVWSDGQ
ncbi:MULTISPECIES: 16S rRNA pseudouridine(516) synthase RsuA [Spongiibacter]|uniref:16S rRNA pseudouridine(516) synthase RsuA n=1 Tax=Spongiibacter TaxID=630749 RepID=UPI0023552556|nr:MULTISPECIES: 16S rRNA pseudouridine(516) synthase RsuA [Spongiibacter]